MAHGVLYLAAPLSVH